MLPLLSAIFSLRVCDRFGPLLGFFNLTFNECFSDKYSFSTIKEEFILKGIIVVVKGTAGEDCAEVCSRGGMNIGINNIGGGTTLLCGCSFLASVDDFLCIVE